MSVIHHEQNYNGELLGGKFFWFSGFSLQDLRRSRNNEISSENKEDIKSSENKDDIKSSENKEDIKSSAYKESIKPSANKEDIVKSSENEDYVFIENNIVDVSCEPLVIGNYNESDVRENSVPNETYSEINEDVVIENHIPLDENVYEESPVNNGTYFKLRGSDSDYGEEEVEEDFFPNPPEALVDSFEESYTIDDYGEDTGTWFGFSGRKRRAESLENLLLDDNNENIDVAADFDEIDQLVMQSFDELGDSAPQSPDIEEPNHNLVTEEANIVRGQVFEEPFDTLYDSAPQPPDIEEPNHNLVTEDINIIKELVTEETIPEVSLDVTLQQNTEILDAFLREEYKEDELSEYLTNQNDSSEYQNNQNDSSEYQNTLNLEHNDLPPDRYDSDHDNEYSLPNGYDSDSENEIYSDHDEHAQDSPRYESKLSERIISQNKNQMKILYLFENKSNVTSPNVKIRNKLKETSVKNNETDSDDLEDGDVVDSYNRDNTTNELLEEEIVATGVPIEHSAVDPIYLEATTNETTPRRKRTISNITSSDENNGDFESSEDEENLAFQRGTSFRRSIVIEDEEGEKRKKGAGVCVSVFFTPISPTNKLEPDTDNRSYCPKLKAILSYLDNMMVSEENFGEIFDNVKTLHSIFWDLKDGDGKTGNTMESLSSVLNYLVVQEWPKIFLGCLRKLKMEYPHVFQEANDAEVMF